MFKVKRFQQQKGYAMISALSIGVVALAITSTIMLRMTSSSSQISKREREDKVMTLSEAVVNHVLDRIADTTADRSVNGTEGDWGIYYSANELIQQLHGTSADPIDTTSNGTNTYSRLQFSRPSIVPATALGLGGANNATQYYNGNSTFWTSLNSNPVHSTSFWSAFKRSGGSAQATPTSLSLGNGNNVSTFSIDDMHKNAYSFYHVKQDSLEADVMISVVPLATNISDMSDEALHNSDTFKNHNDVLKVRVVTYIPNASNARTTRRVDVMVNRPVKQRNFDTPVNEFAILAGNDVDMGNTDTSAGPCAGSGGASCINTSHSGDIHTNGNLDIGANGNVQGKATATGTVNARGTDIPNTAFIANTGDVRDRTSGGSSGVINSISNSQASQSEVDPFPIPEFDTDTSGVDSTPCVDTNPLASVVTYENCKLTGTLDIKNNDPLVEFKGTVHITGNLNTKGRTRCAGPDPCRLVVDEQVDTGGNGNPNFYSGAESLVIVRALSTTSSDANCFDLGGNPDANGSYGTLFYVENPFCGTKFHGNFEFFGGVITKGTFDGKGNATTYGIQRDSDMDSLARFRKAKPARKDELFPAVISWRDMSGNN